MNELAAKSSACLAESVRSVAEHLVARGESLVAAESCTGGLIAAACTEQSGSSAWFDRGFVTYSNQAKIDCLDVSDRTLTAYGAVSEATVAEMLAGVLAASPADWALAISGVAGPNGGSVDKPVGTVVIGWQARGSVSDVTAYLFGGDRAAVRQASVAAALTGLDKRLAARNA